MTSVTSCALPTSADEFHVYFGDLHLGMLDGKNATFSPSPGCLVRYQTEPSLGGREQNIVSG